jgi:PKD repeat protein
VAPYTFRFIFGDGTQATQVSATASVTVPHDFGSYYGVARVSVLVWDPLGDLAVSNRSLIQVLATPLGVPQSASAGDGIVSLTWVTPFSPAAPVTKYVVYYTENAAFAPFLTSFWPYNYSAPYDTTIWNTTATSLSLSVPDGVTLYAQVVAFNLYGGGYLPSDPQNGSAAAILNATPAAIVAGAIEAAAPGGPAPFTDSFSTVVTTGTNGQISSAIYSFGGGPAVTPTVEGSGTTFYLNASYTFLSAGTQTVLLHVNDAFLDVAIQTRTVWVSPGPGPSSVVITTSSGNAWAGALINLTATVGGGTGTYSYSWTLGDTATATGPNVTHAYAKPGEYTATVWVTDNGTLGVTTQSVVVTVLAVPAVAIATSAGPDGSMSFNFTAVYSGGTGAQSFVWVFGDGATTKGLAVTHDYGTGGTYTVEVLATDASGRSTSNTTAVAVPATPSGGGSVNLSGVNSALLAGLAVLAVLFFIGMVYFWSRSRRPPIQMAPEPPEGSNPPPPR